MSRAPFRLRSSRRQRGLSLLESLLATAVSSAVVATGVPAVGNALGSVQLGATTSDLVSAVQLARVEAVSRGERVVVATRAPGQWSSGWRVFVDDNNSGRFEDGERLLRESAPLGDHTKIEAHFGATYRGDVLSYDAQGVARRPGGNGMVLGRITLTGGGAARTLCFSSLTVRSVKAASCA